MMEGRMKYQSGGGAKLVVKFGKESKLEILMQS